MNVRYDSDVMLMSVNDGLDIEIVVVRGGFFGTLQQLKKKKRLRRWGPQNNNDSNQLTVQPFTVFRF